MPWRRKKDLWSKQKTGQLFANPVLSTPSPPKPQTTQYPPLPQSSPSLKKLLLLNNRWSKTSLCKLSKRHQPVTSTRCKICSKPSAQANPIKKRLRKDKLQLTNLKKYLPYLKSTFRNSALYSSSSPLLLQFSYPQLQPHLHHQRLLPLVYLLVWLPLKSNRLNLTTSILCSNCSKRWNAMCQLANSQLLNSPLSKLAILTPCSSYLPPTLHRLRWKCLQSWRTCHLRKRQLLINSIPSSAYLMRRVLANFQPSLRI